MNAAFERTVNHPDMTAELAEILSIPHIPVDYEVIATIGVDERKS